MNDERDRPVAEEREDLIQAEQKSKRILGRDEPGIFDHDVETAGSFKSRGGGLNQLAGPLTCEQWLEIPHRTADPTAWGTNERGRCFFHATPNLFKFWDGTQFLGLVAGPATGFSEGAIPFGRAGGGFLTQDSTKLFFTDGTDTFNVVGTIALTGSLNVTGNSSLDGAVVINDANADKDFRVEGSGATYTHLLFVDASANMVGVNEDAPKAPLHVRLATCADYTGVFVDVALLLEGSGNVSLQLQGATTGSAYIVFCDNDRNPPAGMINYDFPNDWFEFGVGTEIRAYFKRTGALFVQNVMELDSTSYAAFIANAHNADAYFSLEEDEAIKWSMGFDYTDGLKFQISEGIPGTNTVVEIPTGQGSLHFVRAADKGLQYLDTGSDIRWMMRVATGTNVVEILNRASHGKIEIHANTGTAGAAGDVLVATFEDDLITLAVDLRLSSQKELRFYDNGNYVGFEAPALSADQIWILPAADGPANEVLGTDNSGNLIWRTHDELAGFVSGEHFTMLDEDDLVSNSATQAATQRSIKAYVTASVAAAANHAILDGNIHTDSVADTVTRGSIIYGNATPKWDELVLGGANTFLGSDGTDLSYRSAVQVLASLSGVAGAAFAWNSQNLTGIGTIAATTAKLSDLTDGYVPYHVADATGLANSNIFTGGTTVFISGTANTKMTQGLTINQGAYSDEILAFKSSDVAHGMTDYAETDTYGQTKKAVAATGGLSFWGFSEAARGLEFVGIATNDNTSKDATALAPMLLVGAKKNGTAVGAVGADGNVLAVRTWGATKFIVDVDGDILYDGTAGAYQDHDDIALLAELEDVLSDRVSKLEMKKKDIFKKHKVVHVSEGIIEGGEPFFSRFVSTKKKNMLLYGAIRQLNERVEALEASL